MNFDDFKAKWMGRSVDYDGLYGFQCVDLIRQGFKEMHDLPGGGGVPRALNYWTTTPQDVLTKFHQVSNSEAQKGDVVILWGLNGNPDGHIGWATGGLTATQVEIFEQNGSTGNGSGAGADAIRTRWVDRSRIAGLLRPSIVTQQPAPLPPPLSVQDLPYPKQVTVPAGTRRYHMKYRTEKEMGDNFLYVVNSATVITIRAIANHINGHQYYLENPAVHEGYNIKDCPDYIPPYVPPAPPVEYKPVEKYTVITRLMRFSSATDSLHRPGINTTGDVEPGEYYVISKLHEAYNLSDDNMKDRGWWVNTNDNKVVEVQPIPEVLAPTQPVDMPTPSFEPVDPPKPTGVTYLFEAIEPVTMKAINGLPEQFPDLSGAPDAPLAVLNPGTVHEYSMKVNKGGVQHYIPTLSINKGFRHAIPETYLKPVQVQPKPAIQPAYSPFDRDHDGDTDVRDVAVAWDQFVDFGSKHFTNVKNTVYKVTTNPKITEAKTKLTKAVDGFSKRTKK